jgi:hypothetical protein
MDGRDIQKLMTLVIKSQRKFSVGGNRNLYGTVEVKQSRYRPGVAQRVPGS